MFLEIRDPAQKKVSFACYDFCAGVVVWNNLSFEEPWWINLADVTGDVLLFTLYTDTGNPDKKALIAYDLAQNRQIWWRNNFAFDRCEGNAVFGSDIALGHRPAVLDLKNGDNILATPAPVARNFSLLKPLQYFEQTSNFETVKTFLLQKLDVSAVHLIEYLETGQFIIISYFNRSPELANFLYVLGHQGDILFSEKIGDNLSGVSIDTFFVIADFLIFVQNKRVLASLKLI